MCHRLPLCRRPRSRQASAKTFSQQELDQILAPIALYPDALLAQIFMASTYPLEIVEAARWVKANPNVKDKALEEAMQKQAWDPAVKSLTAVPKVLEQMNDKLDWTQKLGDAFLAQQQEVMKTVQSLRAKAKAAGNLESSEEQVVKEREAGQRDDLRGRVVRSPTWSMCLRTIRAWCTGYGGIRIHRTICIRRTTSTRPALRSQSVYSWARRSGGTATGTAAT